ncbi:MAG: 50S ribosomal protein L19 [Candidatus Izemoplasmatales bacterium]|nr:50S ribosomal protein L19 [Candidatus Izemoplasmatales bacterium]
MNVMEKIIKEQCKPEIPDFKVGDTVKVHTRIVEGENERIQIFSGIVIARKGGAIQETFTVRRVSFGQGVEKVFPLHSPRVAKVEVERHGKVRRAKLYYLRDKIGKSAKVKERRYN